MSDLSRDALIDVITRECATTRRWASLALDAVLPLIADAIESNLPTGTDRLSLGISKGKRRAARLVRSLGGNDGSSNDA